jgi:glycosyltransferase involved in cell wall biosynthesis
MISSGTMSGASINNMKISVITTLFNYKCYIEECLLSFLDQKFDESEMIIVDDASVDNPYEVIKKYEGDKIRYIRLDKNMGYSYAKNIGIKHSRSEILIMLDADDVLIKNSIKIRYKKLNKGYDFVHGPALDKKEGRPLVKNRMWDLWEKEKKWKYVHAQGVMLKKEIHRKIGLYDESLRCKSDREMFARIFNHGFKIGVVNDPVVLYRRHKKQMHRSKEKMKINDKLQKEVTAKIKKRKKDLSGIEMLI